MPRMKFGVDPDKAAEAEPGEGGNFYDGPVPPKGVYRGTMKRLRVKKNRNDDHMLNCVIEINEPKDSPKAKYNGYGIWWNGNLNEKGMPYVNQFLDALSGGDKKVRKAFWQGPKVDDNNPPFVLAIGQNFKIDQGGHDIIVNTRESEYNGEPKLEVNSFMYVSGGGSDADDDADDVDDDADDDADDDPKDVWSGTDNADGDDEPPF